MLTATTDRPRQEAGDLPPGDLGLHAPGKLRRSARSLAAISFLASLLIASGSADATPGGPATTAKPSTPIRDRIDDPGISRAIEGVLQEARTGSFAPLSTGPHGARFRLFYKSFQFLCALESPACLYNGMGMMFYPTAWMDSQGFWRALRIGIGLMGAGESSQDRSKWWQHNFGLEVSLALGLQYPARFTPYGELMIGLGALHHSIYNKDFIDFAYSVGIEAGFEVYLTGHLHLSAAFGWRRSIVNAGAGSFYADSWTVSVGFGL